MRKLFININGMDEDFDYVFLSEKEIEEIDKNNETIIDYLTEHSYDNWNEVIVSEKNERKILDLAVEMHKELQPLREGAEAI